MHVVQAHVHCFSHIQTGWSMAVIGYIQNREQGQHRAQRAMGVKSPTIYRALQAASKGREIDYDRLLQ